MSSQQLPATGSTDAESRDEVEETLNTPPGPSETAAELVWASDELMTRIYRLMEKHELVKWLVLDKAGYERVSKEFYRHIDLKVIGQMVMKQCSMSKAMKIAQLVKFLDCRLNDIRKDAEGKWDLSSGYPVEDFPNLEVVNVIDSRAGNRLWVEERHVVTGKPLTVSAKVPQPEPISWGEPFINVRGSTSADLISLHVDHRSQSGYGRNPGARNDPFLESLLLEIDKCRPGVSSLRSLKSFEYHQIDDQFSFGELLLLLTASWSLKRVKVPTKEELHTELPERVTRWLDTLCNTLQHVELLRGGRLSWLRYFRRCVTLNFHAVAGLEDECIRSRTLALARQPPCDNDSRLESFNMSILGELRPTNHMIVPIFIRALTRPTTAINVSHRTLLGRKIASSPREIWKETFDFLDEKEQQIKREKGYWRVSEEKQNGASK